MRFAVIVFPGSNCDHDAYHILKHRLRVFVDFVWHQERDLSKFDTIVVPGGFAHGDYLRAGAIARFSPIMVEVIKAAKKGTPVIGICNGFQVLTESGLLPGTLMVNKTVQFISKNVTLKTGTTDSIFTRNLTAKENLTMPIAHKQGNYTADADTLKLLQNEDRIAFTYTPVNGGNPNGSMLDIAGILNSGRNVLGMMPHPERASEKIVGSKDGIKIFESMVGKA